MTSSVEFSRLVKLDRLPLSETCYTPDAAERAALAERFDLASIDRLEARLTFFADGSAILARGRLEAAFHQPCAVAVEPFANTLDEPLAFRFVPALTSFGEDEEVEFGVDDPDEIAFEGQAFDVGEAIAQSFGLALDPYAEGPGADAARTAGGVVMEGETSGPLADALAALKLTPKS